MEGTGVCVCDLWRGTADKHGAHCPRPPDHPSAGVSPAAALAVSTRVVFNIRGVSVIVTVLHGPGSSKLLGQAGPCQLPQPNWGSWQGSAAGSSCRPRAPSAAPAALNELCCSSINEWMAGISFSPCTGFPEPFLRQQTEFRKKWQFSRLNYFHLLFDFL